MKVINDIKKILEEAEVIKDFNSISKRDVAIIGLSCRIANADSADEFWNVLTTSADCINDFPQNRIKNNMEYLHKKDKESNYYTAGYLSDIEYFDYDLFSISPKEASLMSPNQRLFLETAWHAIEDAGYGGKKIEGSNTGVFLGMSTDFGTSYKSIVETISPASLGMAIPGNLNSTTASRISYHLDLKGPSVVFDTACSSSLSAIHYACQSLRNNECEMALAGSVKVDIVPLNQQKEVELELNITSLDDRSRTFNNDASGQGLGEGVAVLLLKPLYKAVADNDHIYAVIKGSAINQDGRSIGLTAPNSQAQEEVIIKAWEDAQIDPLTIACIEAHGTGTKLGDPVEIEGIQRAFRKYTDKKQFCAIGSVKTNIGHLDHAAGMAGIIKMVLALQKKEIPALIHFNQPNKIINFLDSPVYVNDFKRKWVKSEYPRRGGVSAFGLSGTNCHLILQEAPEIEEVLHMTGTALNILTLSAKNETALLKLVADYILYLNKYKNVNINDLCYTANTGRKYFTNRLAIIFDTVETLINLLYRINKSGTLENYKTNIFYWDNRVMPIKEVEESVDNMVINIGKRFVSSEDVNWYELYKSGNYHRISLPGYHFAKEQCWVSEEYDYSRLLGKCVIKLYDRIVYEREFDSQSHWVINEHIVKGQYVMPGAALIEMVLEAIKENFIEEIFELQEIVFLSPLALNKKEKIKVHTILTLEKGKEEFIVVSQSNNDIVWNKNVTGKISFEVSYIHKNIDVAEILDRFHEQKMVKYEYEDGNEIIMSDRWDCIKDLKTDKDEYFANLEIDSKYVNHQENYFLHPCLFDEAVNLAIRSIGKDLYLPFAYKRLTFYNSMPTKFYCLMKQTGINQKNDDVAVFDIKLFDESGKVFVDISNYIIKKANTLFEKELNKMEQYRFAWRQQDIQQNIQQNNNDIDEKSVLIFRGKNEVSSNITAMMRKNGYTAIEVIIGQEFSVISQNIYQIDGTENSYVQLFKHININKLSEIVHLQSINNNNELEDLYNLEHHLNKGLYSLFYIVKALFINNIRNKLQFTIITDYANNILCDETQIKPYNAALQGISNAISKEYSNISCRFIDVDNATSISTIMKEIHNKNGENMVAFRGEVRYIREIQKVELNTYEDVSVTIRKNGVYIITGGLGSLGYECAKYLSNKDNVILILLSRSLLPPEDTWNTILEEGTDKELCTKINRVIDIKNRGSVVINYSLDISDINAMEYVFNQVRHEYKNINGLIHCAGVPGNGFLVMKDFVKFKDVLLPKLQGTYVLDKITEQDNLDFFVMFSSVTSFICEAGQADYTAANCFLDSYSFYRNKKGKKTVSINWPAWKEIGMAVDFGVDMDKEIFVPIKTADAIQYLDDILHKNICNIIVGNINKELIIDKIKKDKIIFSDEILLSMNILVEELTQVKKQVQKLDVLDNQPMTLSNIIDIITQIWCKVLGFNRINLNESFFDLGGNSINAIYIGKEINIRFPEIIELSDIFTYNTVSKLAVFIFNVMNSQIDQGNIQKEQNNVRVSDNSLDVLLDKIASGEIGEEDLDLLLEDDYV